MIKIIIVTYEQEYLFSKKSNKFMELCNQAHWSQRKRRTSNSSVTFMFSSVKSNRNEVTRKQILDMTVFSKEHTLMPLSCLLVYRWKLGRFPRR